MAEYFDPHAAQVQELERRFRETSERVPEPMYSPEEVAARRKANQRAQYIANMGLITQDAGIRQIAEPMLKQAMEEQKRKVTDHGEFDSMGGTFRYFPQVRQQLDTERLERQLGIAQQRQGEGRRQWDRDRQNAAERAERAQEMAALRLTLKSMGGGGDSDKGSLTWVATDPTTGETIYNHSKQGMVTLDAQGNRVPYRGAPGPKPKPLSEQTTDKLSQANTNLNILTSAIPQAKAIADKKGWANMTMGIVPGYIATRGPIGEAVMSRIQPKEVNNLREQVSNTISLIRSGRYGMTLTPAEMADALQYLPNQYSSAEDVVSKATNLARVLKTAHEARIKGLESQRPGQPPLGPAFGGPQVPGGPITPPQMQRPQPPGPQVPAPAQQGAGALSPEEEAELAQLRARAAGGRQ